MGCESVGMIEGEEGSFSMFERNALRCTLSKRYTNKHAISDNRI